MAKLLISPERVIELAFANAAYTPVSVISPADIICVEARYLSPVVGAALCRALADGYYPEFMNNYVAPTMALYVRELTNLPSAPRSPEGMARARAMMQRLSDYLDENSADYPEYEAGRNVLKRCRINGTHIQIR